MDFLIEIVVQLFVQVVVELLGELLIHTVFRPFAHVLMSRVGQTLLGGLLGLGFGLFWGDHLNGGASWPKLLWVSLALAAAAFVVALGRPSSVPRAPILEQALTPPWRWPAERLLGFAVINLALAGGILLTFRPAVLG